MTGPADDLLARIELPLGGLYRRHPERNLAAIAAAIVGAYRGDGPVGLGSGRSLVVIAVDGLGYAHAAAGLRPDSLTALTSEFPTTTIACLLTSLTGESPDSHGFIGVQYLHADGIRAVNCHDGQVTGPAGLAAEGGRDGQATGPAGLAAEGGRGGQVTGSAGLAAGGDGCDGQVTGSTAEGGRDDQLAGPAGAAAVARPTRTPELLTVFDTLAAMGVPSVVVPNELASLHEDVLGRLLHGARAAAGPGLPRTAGPVSRVLAFGDQVAAATRTVPGGVTWAYLDLDTHIHQHGFDRALYAAVTELDRVARRLRDAGSAVLIFADHGLTRNEPSPATLAAWAVATAERYCRLPAGGAGRTRWIYPHPGYEDRLAARMAEQIPDAVVAGPDQLADWRLIRPGSIGQRRLGEIILIARGADFPAPDVTTAYEHGSMTADEVLIPMAVWSP